MSGRRSTAEKPQPNPGLVNVDPYNFAFSGALQLERFERVKQTDTSFGELSDEYYYSSMPDDIEWYASRCSLDEVGNFYHRCGAYAALSGNTGRITESARLVAEGNQGDRDAKEQAHRIRAIVDHFEESKLGPLLLGTNDLANGPYNVIDGNCRAVALEVLNQKQRPAIKGIRVFIALSRTTKIRSWDVAEW